ncbi:MAG: hypothetical protein J0M00_10515 [Burkholderiales bacterium]|nr:hypothetical protein [Burkholderiales bacterium]MCA0405915.1 hypothetical protein [Pseudomonadota bacterium]
MDGKRSIGRFFGWARPQPAPDELDAADVGTAFGLELSLEPDKAPPATPTDKAQAMPGLAPGPQKRKRGYT